MNTKKAATGFLLSLVFLLFFVYLVSGVKFALGNLPQNEKVFLGSISEIVAGDNEANQTKIVAPEPEKTELLAESALSVQSNLMGFQKIIFQKNSQKQLPIASLTKLMTAVIALDNYKLSQTTSVSKAADLQGPMKVDVKLGDTMSVESFLSIMLVGSSNKSAYALAEIMGEPAFLNLMNQKAKEIEMNNTFYADPTGLSAKNVSTAEDLARLAEYILKNYPKIGSITRLEKIDVPGFGIVENTDQLLGEVPEIVCSKTGYTNQAKGCLLLVVNDPNSNNYIINVILGADDRFLEMQKLIK